MGRKQKYKAQEVIDALREADGIQTEAASILGCTRRTVKNYIDRYVTVKEAYIEAREANVDRMERKLMDAINEGDVTAIKFGLATIGKHRGYVKRQEVTGAGGEPLQIEYVNDWRNAED
jgi:predicted transcriptional regulator